MSVVSFQPPVRLDLAFPEICKARIGTYMDEVEPVIVNFLDATFDGDPKSEEGRTLAGAVLLAQTLGFALLVELQKLSTAEREAAIFQLAHGLLASVIADAASSSATRIINGGM